MPDAEHFDYDVFISYSHKDKGWVRGELLQRIEQAGLKAFIDFRDFRPGAPSIKECERGVVSSRKTLLILTPAYLASEWCEFENIVLATLSPANRDLRLIPVLRAPCEEPPRIGALTHVDFTDGADHDLAWRQLLTALGKPPEPEPPGEPRHEQWFLAHPYPMPPNFTGRLAERAMLSRWLGDDAAHPLLSLRALGGFGKSALVWHWITHDVPPDKWPRVVWWSFYEGDASFDHFVVETLKYLTDGKIDATELAGKNAVVKLLDVLRAPGTLLVLDGFERVLRAFGGLDAAYQGDRAKREDNDHDCISPLAEYFLYHVALQPNVRSKVLLTTRLRPRVLEPKGELLAGAREELLEQMAPADAVAFFHAQGIRGTRAEIETACAPYGYHPLSLRLLAGLIVRDFQHPGDIAAARRLDVSGDLVQRQHHVLETAYDRLTLPRQALLGRIACFRSAVAYDTLKALAETDVDANVDADLHDLVARGLVHRDLLEGRFDLHPIVRRYAYDRLAAPERVAAHTQLRGHFAAVPKPNKVTRLEDLAPVIELYHHTVRAGHLDEAFHLFQDRLTHPLFFQLGAHQLIIDLLRALFSDSDDNAPRLKSERSRGWTLNTLANSYSLIGQPRHAVPLFESSISIDEKRADKLNVAIALGGVASAALLPIGALRVAEANHRRRIATGRESTNKEIEGTGHGDLGELLAYRGAYAESEIELATALKMVEKQVQARGLVWAYRALRALLRLRQAACEGKRRSQFLNSSAALAPARRALKLADEDARTSYPVERDYVRAHWLLGAARRVAGQPVEAESHLHEALDRCRRINMVDHEANILIDLARLRAAADATDEAKRLSEEALLITERSGYVLQGADAHIELARLALARGDRSAAREHATKAKLLATCDGPPDYTYAAAYAEASALLAQLGVSE